MWVSFGSILDHVLKLSCCQKITSPPSLRKGRRRVRACVWAAAMKARGARAREKYWQWKKTFLHSSYIR